MVGFSTTEKREEGGLRAGTVFHTLSLKEVGDQVAWANLKWKWKKSQKETRSLLYAAKMSTLYNNNNNSKNVYH